MDKTETFELKTVLCPITATAKEIRELFGLAPTALERLANAGQVRWCKAGTAEQAGRVFFVSDVLDWLEGNAKRGPKPKRQYRKREVA